MSPSRQVVFALALLVSLAPACERHSKQSPNVLFIVVDTLRADRLGVYGNRRGLTPFLDRLAERGVVFENAYAASSWTCPSVASLFTSRYPAQHHVTGFGSRLGEQEVTFAERLASSGYVAGGFSANYRVLERLGYAQGFHQWRSDAKQASGLQGDELRRQALGWLDTVWDAGSPRPVLLYLQYMEPHSPYDPPEPFLSRYLRDDDGRPIEANVDMNVFRFRVNSGKKVSNEELLPLRRLYDGEVAAADAQIRLLFAELEHRAFLDNAIVIVTADHGEEFGDHGRLEHGRTLYNETVRVPLIVVAPGAPRGVASRRTFPWWTSLRPSSSSSISHRSPTSRGVPWSLSSLGMKNEPRGRILGT